MQKKFEKFVKKYGTPVAILTGAVLIAISIYVSFGLPQQQIPKPANPASVSGQSRIEVAVDDDPVLGAEDAKVTMIEFSDFQCPFCRKFWREAFPQIKKDYIDSGKIKFVYRDFPIVSLHPSAHAAAYAAECAEELGKFWQMHDKIFEEQDREGEGTITFEVTDLKKWAGEIGLAENEFNSCLDSQKYREEVENDLKDGLTAGVQGTPTFYINGRIVRGALNYEQFAQVLEEEL